MRAPDDELRGRIRDLVTQRGQGLAGHGDSHWGHLLSETDIDRFATVVSWLPASGGTLLDVGTGTGVIPDIAALLGFDAMGVDTDARAMAAMDSPHQVASIANLPFADRSVDVVVVSEVWEHLPVDVFELARAEVARVAKSTVIVTAPNAESLESASTRCRQCGCVYSIHGHVRSITRQDLTTLLPGMKVAQSAQFGPFKVRHRSVEWFLRRRILGRWPKQPGATCPQCHYTQPGELRLSEFGATGGVRRLLRTVVGFPWQRWWLIARYERPAIDGHPPQ
jgi:hypothetical protein